MPDPLLCLGSLALGANVIKFRKLLLRWCKGKAEACSSDTHRQFASGFKHKEGAPFS